VRALWINYDVDTTPLCFASQIAPHGARDRPKRYVQARHDWKQRRSIAQSIGDQLLERSGVSRRHRPKIRIHARLQRNTLVIHQGQYALDGTEWVSKIVPQMAEAFPERFGVRLHVSSRSRQREQCSPALQPPGQPNAIRGSGHWHVDLPHT